VTGVDAVLRVVDALTALRIPYMVVGAFSSNAHGRPRSTKDADFVIQPGNTDVNSIAIAIGGGFRLDPQMSFETITASPGTSSVIPTRRS